jgi:hypothetical protein
MYSIVLYTHVHSANVRSLNPTVSLASSTCCVMFTCLIATDWTAHQRLQCVPHTTCTYEEIEGKTADQHAA